MAHPAAAAMIPPAPTFTVREGMVSCGIDDAMAYHGETNAERMASDVFGDTFETCLDKSFEELDADFKTYSDLTVTQGQIRLSPGVKRNVRAFIQWVRDEVRLGRNPSHTAFPVANAAMLLRRYKTHEQFIKRSKTMADAAKPEKFEKETKWND